MTEINLMSSRERKRMQKSKNLVHDSYPGNALITSCHDYASTAPPVAVMAEEPFPPLPVTPCKSPAAKKALYEGEHELLSQDNAVISTLSKLINERADNIEKLVSVNSKKIDENTMKIEGIKKTLDFACSEIRDTQKKMMNVDTRLKEQARTVASLLTRIYELESYSRRWNLKLYGVAEDSSENVKEKAIQICQNILPEDKDKLVAVVDVAHRLGKQSQNNINPRAIIIRFSLRSYRDAIWKSAKNHPFMRDSKLRFAEDLS